MPVCSEWTRGCDRDADADGSMGRQDLVALVASKDLAGASGAAVTGFQN